MRRYLKNKGWLGIVLCFMLIGVLGLLSQLDYERSITKTRRYDVKISKDETMVDNAVVDLDTLRALLKKDFRSRVMKYGDISFAPELKFGDAEDRLRIIMDHWLSDFTFALIDSDSPRIDVYALTCPTTFTACPEVKISIDNLSIGTTNGFVNLDGLKEMVLQAQDERGLRVYFTVTPETAASNLLQVLSLLDGAVSPSVDLVWDPDYCPIPPITK